MDRFIRIHCLCSSRINEILYILMLIIILGMYMSACLIMHACGNCRCVQRWWIEWLICSPFKRSSPIDSGNSLEIVHVLCLHWQLYLTLRGSHTLLANGQSLLSREKRQPRRKLPSGLRFCKKVIELRDELRQKAALASLIARQQQQQYDNTLVYLTTLRPQELCRPRLDPG